jgi:hypothetical protein
MNTPDMLDSVSYASWLRVAKNYGLTDQESDSVIAEALRRQSFGHGFTTLCLKKKAERNAP